MWIVTPDYKAIDLEAVTAIELAADKRGLKIYVGEREFSVDVSPLISAEMLEVAEVLYPAFDAADVSKLVAAHLCFAMLVQNFNPAKMKLEFGTDMKTKFKAMESLVRTFAKKAVPNDID